MILSRFASVLLIPLGDALTIIFSAPIFTTILAKIFLGHKLKAFRYSDEKKILLFLASCLYYQSREKGNKRGSEALYPQIYTIGWVCDIFYPAV